jgi:TolB-like protein/Tfp pilus assembly protein PilF
MEGEAPTQASTLTGAVFLSYASQDAEAAQRICAAFRSAGVEVWFDQSELRGGDAWDQSIRKQIKSCALFVPIISKNSHERAEGYFRLEWKLAVDRSHLIMANKAFLVPVVIDDTADDDENVPEKFREVQWTRLPNGETPPEFVARIKRLLSPAPPITARLSASAAPGSLPIPLPTRAPSTLKRAVPVAVAVLSLAALAYLLIDKPWISKPATPVGASSNATSSPATPAAFTPPPHSVAVLPFVNMSRDKEQDYFSDGLTEEILNSLARINELQVSARTSSFYFKGKDADLPTIGHKLNVGSVLEGSVRRSGHTIRITAQLNNAVTGFHLWSQTYDRDLGDVLKLQTEIATAVANALKVALLADIGGKIELGGTLIPGAFDAYVRARKGDWQNGQDAQRKIAAYSDAIRLDPHYALAYAGRSFAFDGDAVDFASGSAIAADRAKALGDARQALALAPDLPEGHEALAYYFAGTLQITQARDEFARAVSSAPGYAAVLRSAGHFSVSLGRTAEGLAMLERAVARDPISADSYDQYGDALYLARRYQEAVTVLQRAVALDGARSDINTEIGLAYYSLGDYRTAATLCEVRSDYWIGQLCLAVTYEKLGRRADAAAMRGKMQAAFGDASANEYALIDAQWGDKQSALRWLEKAFQLRDAGLARLKTEPLMDPLRKEPRFQSVMRELKFPD